MSIVLQLTFNDLIYQIIRRNQRQLSIIGAYQIIMRYCPTYRTGLSQDAEREKSIPIPSFFTLIVIGILRNLKLILEQDITQNLISLSFSRSEIQ